VCKDARIPGVVDGCGIKTFQYIEWIARCAKMYGFLFKLIVREKEM
jgi:hypothetical protein